MENFTMPDISRWTNKRIFAAASGIDASLARSRPLVGPASADRLD
jgi:hypothetical protein